MRVCRITAPIRSIPVDFRADPDGLWEYDELAQLAGFDPTSFVWGNPVEEGEAADSFESGDGPAALGQLALGALTEPCAGFPPGAAVLMLTRAGRSSVVFVDCTVREDRAA